jgi:hypothetical protein
MSSDPGPEGRDPGRPLPPPRTVPAIDPTAPLASGLRLSPEELAEQAAKPPAPPSRRFVLGTGVLVLAGAGAGAGYSFWRTRHPAHRVAPTALVEAARAERVLVATLDDRIARFPKQAPLLRQLRLDHALHSAALDAAVREHTGTLPHPGPAAAVTKSRLIDTERRAAADAARRALALTGRDAALLASISACEAAHVELLR